MTDPAALLRASRLAAGLTQVELARRLGVTQPTVAAWERPGANPTVRTLERALGATGHRLQLLAPTWGNAVDGSLVRAQLELSPLARLRQLEAMQRGARALRRARRATHGA